MADTDVKITLLFPIDIEGQEIAELTIRRPKVKDQTRALKSKGHEADQEIKLFADLCMQTPAVMEELDLEDYNQVREAYENFLSSRQRKRGAGV